MHKLLVVTIVSKSDTKCNSNEQVRRKIDFKDLKIIAFRLLAYCSMSVYQLVLYMNI